MMVTVPLAGPAIAGAKPIFTCRVAPAATVKLEGGKTVKGGPLVVIVLTIRSAVPVLLMVSGKLLDVFTVTLPKGSGDGVTWMAACGVTGVMLADALLLPVFGSAGLEPVSAAVLV